MAGIYIEQKLVWIFLITVIVVLALSVYSYVSIQRFIEAGKWQDHTRQVINVSENILSTTIDMETAQRGFVITAEKKFLAPYHNANENIDSLIRELRILVQDNAVQDLRVNQLVQMINNKSDWVNGVIAVRKQNFEEAQNLIKSEKGEEMMDAIRQQISVIQQEEGTLYSQRNFAGQSTLSQFQASFVSMLVITALFITVLFFLINAHFKARIHAENQLQTASAAIQDLYDKAPCGYLSVDANLTLTNINLTLLDWMGYKPSEVIGKLKYADLLSEDSRKQFLESFETDFSEYQHKGYVNSLEFEFIRKDRTTFPVLVNSAAIFDEAGNFVKSRTTVFDNTARKEAEERANLLRKEMEAFTYSVSHDLRAPLRFIGGYAQMLEEDYKDKLDAEGNRILSVIQKNAERMGHLIDDLLDFSRMGRKELMVATVSVNQLVAEAQEEFQLHQNPKVTLSVSELGTVKADMSMLKQVWINLISNAVKYSKNQPASYIEIGRIDAGIETQFYVKDNGVGFDMQYAHKLYEVFQRLHKVQEFEGTGVGLALVKRIVVRHGGRVWASSRPGEGATFYFSLPNL